MLHRLKDALSRATPGEWEKASEVYVTDADGIVVCRTNYGRELKEYSADTEFIVLAHNLMPDLIEAAEALHILRGAYLDEDREKFLETAQGMLAGDVVSKILEKLKGEIECSND